jgi:hypothetical protein
MPMTASKCQCQRQNANDGVKNTNDSVKMPMTASKCQCQRQNANDGVKKYQ